jgi:AraC-like DNA-binding protein
MSLLSVSAATIALWEAETGPAPIHGLGMELALGGTIEAHRHARGQVMTAPAGVITVKVAGRSYVVSGKRGVWIPEGVPHEVLASTDVKLRNLQISRALAPGLPDSACLIAVSPLFAELLGSAVEGEQWVQEGSREAKILELLIMEFHVANDLVFSFPEPRDARLRKICSALQRNPADNRSLAEWSAIAGACTRTLERLFHRETGLTFAQWRRQLRLQDAIIRLHRGQPVTSVAFDAGYDNTSSFIEMFRRMTGRTPGQFLVG